MSNECWLDELSRALAGGVSRKQFLKVAAAAVVGAFLPRPERAEAGLDRSAGGNFRSDTPLVMTQARWLVAAQSVCKDEVNCCQCKGTPKTCNDAATSAGCTTFCGGQEKVESYGPGTCQNNKTCKKSTKRAPATSSPRAPSLESSTCASESCCQCRGNPKACTSAPNAAACKTFCGTRGVKSFGPGVCNEKGTCKKAKPCPGNQVCCNTTCCEEGRPCVDGACGCCRDSECGGPCRRCVEGVCVDTSCSACEQCNPVSGACEPKTCPVGQVCNPATGSCGECSGDGDCPTAKPTCCGGVCTNVRHGDVQNCGACGIACAAGQVCCFNPQANNGVCIEGTYCGNTCCPPTECCDQERGTCAPKCGDGGCCPVGRCVELKSGTPTTCCPSDWVCTPKDGSDPHCCPSRQCDCFGKCAAAGFCKSGQCSSSAECCGPFGGCCCHKTALVCSNNPQSDSDCLPLT